MNRDDTNSHYRLRKSNRRSGPVRATERGTHTVYPRLNPAKLRNQRDRYAGTDARHAN